MGILTKDGDRRGGLGLVGLDLLLGSCFAFFLRNKLVGLDPVLSVVNTGLWVIW